MLHDTYPVLFNFWRPSRYCSSSNHYVLRDSQQFRLISEGVGSVPAVYQVLSLEQKSKVIFVPGSFLRTRDIPRFVFGCDKEKEQT